MFRYYIVIFRERAFWEMLNWGAVDRILWMGVFFSSDLVRGNLRSISTAPQLSISQEALGMLPEDGNVIPQLVGATIHN
jgi:hypothetical protein